MNRLQHGYLLIGITSNYTITAHSFSYRGGNTSYNYCYQGYDGKKGASSIYKQYGDKFEEGDIISVELNTVNGALTFYKNFVSQGVAWNVKQADDISYKLAACMWRRNDSISIIKLESKLFVP